METRRVIDAALFEVRSELASACQLNPPMASAHEGFAVIMEELDELREHVWMKPRKRDVLAMRKEATQLAAMAIRFMVDICGGGE